MPGVSPQDRASDHRDLSEPGRQPARCLSRTYRETWRRLWALLGMRGAGAAASADALEASSGATAGAGARAAAGPRHQHGVSGTRAPAEIARPSDALHSTAMRVYAVCRNCAEVHLADDGCRGCARALALRRALPGSPDPQFAAGTRPGLGARRAPSVPAPEPATCPGAPARPLALRVSTAVIAIYLIAVFGLLAAALSDM